MNADTTSVQVNFGKPFPLFPLDSVSLMPHAMLRLFIFEPRYRQMVEDVLDGAGQIAMAVFHGDKWMSEYDANPALRPAVCIGQVARHEKLPDGTYHIWLHGICRARIVEEQEPDGVRLYRRAMLAPLESSDPDEESLTGPRERLTKLLHKAPLSELKGARHMLEELEKNQELPTSALLEAITLAVLTSLNDQPLQYRLLEEGDPAERAKIIERELGKLAHLLSRAQTQFDPEAPKGISWN